MTITLLLALAMMLFLFLMIWAAAYFLPWKRLLDFFPQDIKEAALGHQPPFPAAPVIGWV